MAHAALEEPVNPYHYARHCLGGKWKMTLLHEICTFGTVRFNHIRRVLPVSEKVLSQQLKELVEDGLVMRCVDDTTRPPSTEYHLTKSGAGVMAALDLLYIWSIREMTARGIEIDTDALLVHQAQRYSDALRTIIPAYERESRRAGELGALLADGRDPRLDGEPPAVCEPDATDDGTAAADTSRATDPEDRWPNEPGEARTQDELDDDFYLLRLLLAEDA